MAFKFSSTYYRVSGNTMNPFLILIPLILILSTTFGQTPKNKSAIGSWDSLFMSHDKALKFFNNYIDSALYKCDTATMKGSVTISKFSKDSLLLQKTIKTQRMVNYGNDSLRCIEDIREEFYNTRGLIAYVRKSNQDCSIRIDAQNEKIFYIYYYERFEYDENDNLTIRVFNISTPMTIKESYENKNGKWTMTRQRINETDFWK